METFVEGHTEPIDYDLKKAPTPGATPVTFDAENMDIEMVITGKYDVQVNTEGKVTWADEANSRARFSPADGDLLAANSPYRVHWKVTDTSGKVAWWPPTKGEEWIVYRQ